jgi:hypothetical protein
MKWRDTGAGVALGAVPVFFLLPVPRQARWPGGNSGCHTCHSKPMRKASLWIILLLIAIPARAQVEQHRKDITTSGKVFLEACSSVDKRSDQLNSYETHTVVQCLSYVDGIFETMSLVDNLHLQPRGFCAPREPVQRKKLVQIVRKYIADHPETSNERTIALVWVALSQTFPCIKATT